MIGSGAFEGCGELKKATFLGFSSVGASVFDNTPVTIYGYNNTMIQMRAQDCGYTYVVINPEIQEVTAERSGDDICVNVNSYFTQGADLFAVSYKGGNMVDSKKIADGTATLNGKADNVRIFCWESLESMRPLCRAAQETVQ